MLYCPSVRRSLAQASPRPGPRAEGRGSTQISVLDYVAERRPPFSPDQVVAEYAAALKSYGVTTVQADKYAGQWVVEAFAKQRITCEQSAEPKSVIYGNVLPLLNSGRVELLDQPRLQAQLLSLERRTARGGRDTIDHAPGGHDDLANAVAGALVAALGPAEPGMLTWIRRQAEEAAKRQEEKPLGMREHTIGGPLDPAERERRLRLIEEQERRLWARW